MFNRKLTLPTESRIHGDMYVRFGGRYGETYRRKTTRRPIPSLLMLHCEKEGYTIPRFCTFDCVQRLNKPGKNGEELRAETEQTGQERRGTAEGIGTERREIVSRHADHIYLHPQGDQGEDQV